MTVVSMRGRYRDVMVRALAIALMAVSIGGAHAGSGAFDGTLLTTGPGAHLHGAHTAQGLVTGVSDGDTLHVMIDGTSTRVRLAQIDAPEKGQAFGRRAEQSLRELVGQRVVSLTWRKVDRYGRPIVQMVVDSVDVNAEQVRRGFAWVYRAYSHDARLIDLEAQARQAKRGLWADPHPIEPWEWRKRERGDIAMRYLGVMTLVSVDR